MDGSKTLAASETTGLIDTAFDFDTVVDRRVTDSVKWGIYGEDVLPMWVADMDFLSPPAVIRALRERAEHGIFGYELSPGHLPELITERLARLYDWYVEPDAIVFLPESSQASTWPRAPSSRRTRACSSRPRSTCTSSTQRETPVPKAGPWS